MRQNSEEFYLDHIAVFEDNENTGIGANGNKDKDKKPGEDAAQDELPYFGPKKQSAAEFRARGTQPS